MLSGPLGGSLFNRNLFMRTQIWTSTLTSQAMKRQRNLSLRTILKSLVLLLWPIPHVRRPFLLLTPELCAHLCLPDVDFHIFLLMYTCLCFFFVGTEAQDICSLHFNKYSSFFFIVCVSLGYFTFLLELYSPN